MVFVRTAFFDILDMQGDQIVGKETIPIILGEKKTMRLLKLMLIISFIVLLLSNIFHLTTNLGFIFLAYPVILFIVFSSHEQGYMLPGIRLEFLVDTHFVLSGILSFAWSMATGL
jgi:4-hydroxy-3-methylbut-2-enyl diphosphate reductase